MIEAKNLWKSYGPVDVLRGIDFSIESGRIAGFLGANGAGKTTCMRILTTYFPPERGTAVVAGHDIRTAASKVCESIGYLPESMPVYPEMRVGEYLAYRAVLRGLPRRAVKQRVAEVIEECFLKDVEKRLLTALSKGYKQRLGLADALLHDPPVLILDEPTAGLDPRQVLEVRKMIEGFRGRKTVLLSSHVLGEVEQVCDVVTILHDGKIRASQSRDEWQGIVQRDGKLRVVLADAAEDAGQQLEQLAGVDRALRLDSTTARETHFELGTSADVRRSVFDLASQRGWQLLELTPVPQNLEDLFLKLTGAAEESAA
ncbi:MAG: ATP-binding cassette domain-containing protein [Planctomycetota bacterium]